MVGNSPSTNLADALPCRRPRILCMVLGALVLLLPASVRAGAFEERTGEQIYRQMCASCHGAEGEGTDEFYPRPLAGNRSVAQLSRLISMTMPEDDPDECVDEEAERVSQYIYDAFYSRVAQARNKPPRIELSRLTVRQYQNAVTDLIGSFRGGASNWTEERGLKGEYFASRRFRPDDRVLERVDPEVAFDFGKDSPDSETMDSAQFSIRWEGSVLAPETGHYEFVIHTDHAGRLWVNDNRQPLIDAWVKSGDDTEFRESIFLIGGRFYPLRLEFSKAKQGVDDSDKNEPPEVDASITLAWKLPKRADETIPERNLVPERFPELFVVETRFPPDDRSMGYERGTSVSKEWAQAATDAAIETANYVANQIDNLAGLRNRDRPSGRDGRRRGEPREEEAEAEDSAENRDEKLRDFCRSFVERAFRRPLTDEQAEIFIDRQFESAPDQETAIKRIVLLTLNSPRFLYQEAVEGTPDPYDVATRLSFGLWDSLPDAELLTAAAEGALETPEQVAEQAERMADDPRTRSKVREFLHQWLRVDEVPDLSKDSEAFPDFDRAIASDLRTSLDLFLEDVVWNDASDFRQVLLADFLYLNGRLASIYGGELDPDEPFQKVILDSGERAGALTHPYLLANFAYETTSSPIHRGVFLARSVVGETLRQPPEAFSPLAPDLHPDLTTRERVALQTSPDMCMSCHATINPLGFSLEHYDAVGRYRAEEKGKPIDASGTYQARSGAQVSFNGARDLAAFLSSSEDVHTAFAEQLFQYLVKQPIRAYGSTISADLRRQFGDHQFNIRSLLVEIMAASALTARTEAH